MNYPPYTITNKMLDYVSEIMEKIGEINSFLNLDKKPELRKQTMINSIYSSLAIENNPLSLGQVKDIINGHLVIGKQKDIQEVKNAYKAYEELDNINPYSESDLRKIHGIITNLILEDNGKYRNHGEGVYDCDVCIHVAPSEKIVPELMGNLFTWINNEKGKVNPLILSSIFHYEFLFIHPFSDGNGRVARIWQTAILSNWKDIFGYIPIENLIKENQEEYYRVIAKCNNAGNSTIFIEFVLKMIIKTIDKIVINQLTTQNTTQDTTQEKIINLIRENPNITQIDMAKKIGITRDGITYNLKILKEKGIIERVGSTRNGNWIVL